MSSESQSPIGSPDPMPPRAGETGIVWTIWLTYGAFYFCRTNLSVAVDGMGQSVSAGGLGLTSDQIGWILASLKLAYGCGQLLNGQLSEIIRPRRLLAVGMLGSAALNVLFGFSTGFYFLLFVWACNGYCQSLGWTPCVRVIGNWIPILRRGKAIGIIGTGYQVTLGVTYFVAGQSAELLGWRAALYVPAALLALTALFMLVALKESPDDPDAESKRAVSAVKPGDGLRHMIENLRLTLSNPKLWLLGISLGLLNACRYGFLDWGIKHLVDVQGIGVGKAGLKFVVLAAGAAAGSYVAGWATDRFFGNRRAPVICLLLLGLSALTIVYESVARMDAGDLWLVVLLFVIGFCIYGPQVLLVGTAPADLAKRGTSAAAAGFVNFLGYMGAATGDVVTGVVSPDQVDGGPPLPPEAWSTAIYIWAGWALVAAACSAVLWNAIGHDEGESTSTRADGFKKNQVRT